MQHTYYIDSDGIKDGPHDLVTVMRRIRLGKILPDTPIYIDDAATALAASRIDDLTLFFGNGAHCAESEPPPSLTGLLAGGWHFTMEHNVMTVYAGGMLLLAMMLASGLVGALGLVTGGMLAWVVLVIFHNIYLVYALRLYRGQTLSSDFTGRFLAPILPRLLAGGAVLALMMAGGLFLLVIPGVVVAVIYIFAPFLMLDRRYGMVEAMQASRLLLQKNHRRHFTLVTLLVALHLACLLLIIPIPLTLPVFAASLAKLYEQLSSS